MVSNENNKQQQQQFVSVASKFTLFVQEYNNSEWEKTIGMEKKHII